MSHMPREGIKLKSLAYLVMCATLLLAVAVGVQAAQGKPFAGETIRVLLYEQIPSYALVERLPEFTEATGIRVEYELLAESAMEQREMLDFSSHTGTYDVTNVHFWYIPQFARAKYIEPLDPLIATQSDPRWKSIDDFVPSYLEAMKHDGKIYGLPFQGIVQILYYRKDLFEKYNIKIPTTMTELMAAAKALTLDVDKDGKIDIYGYTDRGSADPASFMSPVGWIYAWGVSFLDKDMKPQLNTPQAVAAVTHYVTLLKEYGPPGQANMGWAEAEQALLSGKAAMHIDTHDLAPDMDNPQISQVAGKIGFALPPKEVRYSQDFFASGLSINADSKHKGAAWLFVQWATSTALQREIVKTGQRSDFTSQSVLGSAEFKKTIRAADVILKASKVADPAYFPRIPEFGQLADVFCAAVSRAVAEGPESVPGLMKEADKKIADILAKAGYYEK